MRTTEDADRRRRLLVWVAALCCAVVLGGLVAASGWSQATKPPREELPPWARGEPAPVPDVDRSLSADEATEMVQRMLVALDRTADRYERDNGMERLSAHKAVLPLLRAMALDPTEDWAVRCSAVTKMRSLWHKSVIPVLIEVLGRVEERNVRTRAFRRLRELTGRRPLPAGTSEADWEAYVREWEAWWQEHEATFEMPAKPWFFIAD